MLARGAAVALDADGLALGGVGQVAILQVGGQGSDGGAGARHGGVQLGGQGGVGSVIGGGEANEVGFLAGLQPRLGQGGLNVAAGDDAARATALFKPRLVAAQGVAEGLQPAGDGAPVGLGLAGHVGKSAEHALECAGDAVQIDQVIALLQAVDARRRVVQDDLDGQGVRLAERRALPKRLKAAFCVAPEGQLGGGALGAQIVPAILASGNSQVGRGHR